jgi:acyl carrier protein
LLQTGVEPGKRPPFGETVNSAAQVTAEVDRILNQQFEIEPDLIVPGARLKDDLDLDSLDGADLMIAIEKRFGVRLDEAAARSFRTVGDIHTYVSGVVVGSRASA